VNPRAINLLPLPRLQAMSRRCRVRRWLAASACYAALLVVGYAMCMASSGSDVDATGAALDKVNRQIDDLNHSLAALRPQLAEMQAKLSVAKMVGDQPNWSLLLAIISSTLDEEIVLSSARLDSAGAGTQAQQRQGAAAAPTSRPSGDGDCKLAVTLQGFAKTQGAMSQFVLRLERLGLFERVEMMNSSRQQFGANGEATGFRVECELRRTGGANPSAKGMSR
jgi:Tfp pilus assembly protein PilN